MNLQVGPLRLPRETVPRPGGTEFDQFVGCVRLTMLTSKKYFLPFKMGVGIFPTFLNSDPEFQTESWVHLVLWEATSRRIRILRCAEAINSPGRAGGRFGLGGAKCPAIVVSRRIVLGLQLKAGSPHWGQSPTHPWLHQDGCRMRIRIRRWTRRWPRSSHATPLQGSWTGACPDPIGPIHLSKVL